MHDGIEGELRPGETLLWAGKSAHASPFAPEDLLLLPLLVVWAAGGFSRLAPRWAIFLLLCVGACLKPLRRSWFAKNTVYAVTDQRLLARTERRLRDLRLADVGSIELRPGADGGGTIHFYGRNLPRFLNRQLGGDVLAEPLPPFRHLRDARTVYELIEARLGEARRSVAKSGSAPG